jgi:hypothetical protein
MPLGQPRKFLEKLAADVRPKVIVARTDNIGRLGQK